MYENLHNVRVDVRDVHHVYETPAGAFPALRGVSFAAVAGEFVAVVGRSGSGKSTLLNMITGIDRPTSGSVVIDGDDLTSMSEGRLARWRAEHVGLVFQFQQLLPTLTVVENVLLPMDFAGRRGPGAVTTAMTLLERVGVADQADKLPSSLSGGQQQRASIARALANDPSVIAADEPTGNLDSHTADTMLDLFRSLADQGKTVVMVTHERDITPWTDRVVTMSDGLLAEGNGAREAIGG